MGNKFYGENLHNLARLLKLSLMLSLGEKEFVRQLLAFDREVEGKQKRVLSLLLTTKDPDTFQLAVLWLDGKGWCRRLEWLEIVNLRRRVINLPSNKVA